MKITALLPMKKHSERISKKNLRLFSGYPLYHMIARVLTESSYVDKIIINTDCPAIAEDALQNFFKVVIHERPLSLRGDMVPMNDIIGFDISRSPSEHFLQTHSTNPLLTRETLEQAIETYFGNLAQYDSLFSVSRLQTRLYLESGKPVNHDPAILLRTQDLPPLFEENSNIYIFSKSSFQEAGKRRIGVRPKLFEMNKLEAIDIDEEEDFIIAEAVMQFRMHKT